MKFNISYPATGSQKVRADAGAGTRARCDASSVGDQLPRACPPRRVGLRGGMWAVGPRARLRTLRCVRGLTQGSLADDRDPG
jgi:hypothetical protein